MVEVETLLTLVSTKNFLLTRRKLLEAEIEGIENAIKHVDGLLGRIGRGEEVPQAEVEGVRLAVERMERWQE